MRDEKQLKNTQNAPFRVKVNRNSRDWMTLCEKERIWEEENKAKGKITSIKPTGGIAFMSLKKRKKRTVFGTCQAQTVQRRRLSTATNTHRRFSMNSKHFYFETCQRLRNCSRLKASNSSSLLHVIAGGLLRAACDINVCFLDLSIQSWMVVLEY